MDARRIMRRIYMPQVLSFLFQSVCFVGFSYQAIGFVEDYFKYTTESDVMIQTPIEVPVPDFTACFRYVDVLDFDQLRVKYRNASLKPIESLTAGSNVENTITGIHQSVTIEDIFNFSPAHDEILSQCSTKKPKDFTFEEHGLDGCNKEFSIWKFYLQEYICYRFKKIGTPDSNTFRYRTLSYALDRPGTIFVLKINNSRLLLTRYMKAVINPCNRNPEASLSMTTNIKRRFDDENLGQKDDPRKNYFIFAMSYSDLKITRMEPPYDTGCRDYAKSTDYQSAIECRSECNIDQTVKAFGKVPFSVSIWNWTAIIHYLTDHGDSSDESEDLLQEYSTKEQQLMQITKLRHLTNADLLNEKIADRLMQIENECQARCRAPDCQDEVTLTKGSFDYIREEDLRKKGSQFLEFEISVPKKPKIIITYKEKVTWSEFLVYLLSCFGIWFGLSVLSINPFNLKIGSLTQRSGVKDFCIQMRELTRKQIRDEVEAMKNHLKTG